MGVTPQQLERAADLIDSAIEVLDTVRNFLRKAVLEFYSDDEV